MKEIRECEISMLDVVNCGMPLNKYAMKVIMKQKGIEFDGVIALKHKGVLSTAMCRERDVMIVRQEF